MTSRERELTEALEADCEALTGLVLRQWALAADPLGSVMLVPRADDADPCTADELPWPEVVREFRAVHGRPPRPGARALAQRRLTGPRHRRGGIHG